MNQAAQVIDMQDQLIIKEFGIEEITTANIALMEKQIREIPEKPETKEQYDNAYRYNVDAKKLLPRIEERRRELKAPILEKGKAIDATAKKAVAMVQPLIELSGTRREAWEAEKAAEKAEKDRIEAERMAAIQAKFDMLNNLAGKPMEYNRASEDIARDICHINAFEISAIDFRERMDEAELVKTNAIKSAELAFENRKKFEAEQVELARVKAEHEVEAKRLEEERAKLETDRKAQEEANRKAAEAEAEIRRIEAEEIRAEREALEAEKARIAMESVWEEAHQLNIDFDHAAAIIENDRRKAEAQAAQADFEAAHAAALVEHEEYLKRQQLLAQDKLKIQEQINIIDTAISDIKPCDFATDEAAKVIADLYIAIKGALSLAEKLGAELR